ncbi:MAG: hypothetical protein HKN51_13045 [Saprospiraceae bacterium]|nr:hypothetical protein [Saprospiraceae bacterium]
MKKVLYFFFVIIIISCSSSDDCSLDITVSFYQGSTLKICDDMEQVVLQGIDSEVGILRKIDSSLVINYDNGGLAGLYVGENESKEIGQSVNQEFWYTTRNNTFYVTFPTPSGDTIFPYFGHNFYSNDLEEKDLILDIMRTFEYQ